MGKKKDKAWWFNQPLLGGVPGIGKSAVLLDTSNRVSKAERKKYKRMVKDIKLAKPRTHEDVFGPSNRLPEVLTRRNWPKLEIWADVVGGGEAALIWEGIQKWRAEEDIIATHEALHAAHEPPGMCGFWGDEYESDYHMGDE